MAQTPFNGAQVPESVKAQILADQLMQKSAAENTPFTSRGVGLAKIGTGLLGGIMEGITTRNEMQAQAAHRVALANALMGGTAQPGAAQPAAPAVAPGDPSLSPIGPGSAGAQATAMSGYGNTSPGQVESMIRSSAAAHGIDPDTAVAVARSEGLHTYAGDNNSSFGPFQLHYGNVAGGGNAVTGMGDDFTKQTGLDARDPSTLPQQIDFSMKNAAQNGWGAWHGAKNSGIGNFQGIGQAPQTATGQLAATPGSTFTPKGSFGNDPGMSADMPAPGATATGSTTLPPGVTADMISGSGLKPTTDQIVSAAMAKAGYDTTGLPGAAQAAPASPYGGPPQPMQPQPSPAALAAVLAQQPTSAPASPFGGAPQPMTAPQTPSNSATTMLAAPPPDMSPAPADANAPPDDSAPDATTNVSPSAPALPSDPNAPPSDNSPDQTTGLAQNVPPALMPSMLQASADPGVGNMLPNTPPMPPPGAQTIPQGNPYGGPPQPMAPPLTISPAAMAAALQPQAPVSAAPLSTDNLPGMDNFNAAGGVQQSSLGGVGYTGRDNADDPITAATQGGLQAPQSYVGGDLGLGTPSTPAPSPAALAKALSQTPGSSDDPAIRPFGQLNQASAPGGVVSGIQAGVAPPPLPPAAYPHPGSLAAGGTGQQAPLPQMAAANLPPPNMQPSPAALANALAPAPGTGPALPQTGPMPPAGAQTMANAGVNPDAPAPGAIQAGPAPISPQAMAQALAPNAPQPMGLPGKSNGSDPMSPQNFQQQVALANALAPGASPQSSPSPPTSAQGGAAAPQPGPAAMQSPQGAPQQAGGGLFSGLGSIFGGGQQQAPQMPAGLSPQQQQLYALMADPRTSPQEAQMLLQRFNPQPEKIGPGDGLVVRNQDGTYRNVYTQPSKDNYSENEAGDILNHASGQTRLDPNSYQVTEVDAGNNVKLKMAIARNPDGSFRTQLLLPNGAPAGPAQPMPAPGGGTAPQSSGPISFGGQQNAPAPDSASPQGGSGTAPPNAPGGPLTVTPNAPPPAIQPLPASGFGPQVDAMRNANAQAEAQQAGAKASAEANAKNDVDEVAGSRTKLESLRNSGQDLAQAQAALDSYKGKMPTGPFGQNALWARGVANSVGLGDPNQLSNMEIFAKNATKVASAQIKEFTSKGTNLDLETELKNNPGVNVSDQSNRILIDHLGRTNAVAQQYEQAKQRFYDQNGSLRGFQPAWENQVSGANAIPLSKFPVATKIINGQPVAKYLSTDPSGYSLFPAGGVN